MKIGIMGLAGAGKDTVAARMQGELGAHLDRFAAPLKGAAEYAFGPNFDNRASKEKELAVTDTLADLMLQGAIECCEYLGFTAEEQDKASELYFDCIGNLSYCSPRLYQQLLGTEVIRKVRDSAFVDRIKNRGEHSLLVPDCRFSNEVAVFDKLFLVVRREALPEERPAHPSEHLAYDLTTLWYDGLMHSDSITVIENDGTIEELEQHIKAESALLLGSL